MGFFALSLLHEVFYHVSYTAVRPVKLKANIHGPGRMDPFILILIMRSKFQAFITKYLHN